MNSGLLEATDLQSLLEEVKGVGERFADDPSPTATQQTAQGPWNKRSQRKYLANHDPSVTIRFISRLLIILQFAIQYHDYCDVSF